MIRVRTLIWGGCVSRDTFEYLPAEYELIEYIARQSWLSADRPAPEFDMGSITSAFQRRVTAGDITGNALDRIRAHADQIDLLLLDLFGERLGVVDLGEGAVVTKSIEKIASGVQEWLDEQGRVLSFGEEEHYERWALAADDVLEVLRKHDLLSKTLVLAPEWAMFDDEAAMVPTSYGMVPGEMNGIFEDYYATLERKGFRVVRIGPTVAGSHHKWGRAPFHYHDSVYDELAKVIKSHSSPRPQVA